MESRCDPIFLLLTLDVSVLEGLVGWIEPDKSPMSCVLVAEKWSRFLEIDLPPAV